MAGYQPAYAARTGTGCSVMVPSLLYVLMMSLMCIKWRNFRINCSVLMSVILFVLLLLHVARA